MRFHFRILFSFSSRAYVSSIRLTFCAEHLGAAGVQFLAVFRRSVIPCPESKMSFNMYISRARDVHLQILYF